MKKILALAAGGVLAAASAQAATISVQTFSAAAYSAYTSGLNNFQADGFEDIVGSSQEVGIVDSAVGNFTSIGGTGTGSSVIGSGEELAVRTQGSNPFGRTNTTPGGEFYLDSNDTFGIGWVAARDDGGLFNSAAFTLSDAADVGAKLSISADGETLDTLLNLANANVQFVVITFSSLIANAEIRLENTDEKKTNDGFAIDDATLGVAPVPLPAAGLMLLGGLAGFGALRRRQRSA